MYNCVPNLCIDEYAEMMDGYCLVWYGVVWYNYCIKEKVLKCLKIRTFAMHKGHACIFTSGAKPFDYTMVLVTGGGL